MPSKTTMKKAAKANLKQEAPKPGAALAALQALGARKPAPAGSPTIVQSLTDPAMQGATKKGSVVHLGLDPSFADRAKTAAELHAALEDAQAAFAVLQSECRDYGAKKRVAYNDLFNADVTTVCIPYEVDDPSAPDGKGKKYVQAVCTNKYSVQQDVIQGSKEALGEYYDRLFEEVTTRTLKPNAEDLLRNLFMEQFGMSEEQVNATLDGLRDVKVTVTAKEDYEKQSRNVPEAVKTILDQGVKRQQPSLRFR